MGEGAVTIVATSHGIEVPAAPMIGPRMAAHIDAERYERQEIACGLAAIPPGARILEMGAGAGVVGAILAKHCNPAEIRSIEANPNLIPHIENLYRHNGLDGVISVTHCVVLSAPDAPDTVTFHLAGNLLGSSLTAYGDKPMRAVEVPVLRYSDLTRDYPHDVIMMDIEGAELDFLRHADLSGVNLVILEVHRDIYGREGVRECRQLLSGKGFTQDSEISMVGVHVWRRDAAAQQVI